MLYGGVAEITTTPVSQWCINNTVVPNFSQCMLRSLSDEKIL